MEKCCRTYLALGAAIIAVYLTLPTGLPRDIAYFIVGLSCVAAILAGVRRQRPRHALPWYLMAAGQLMWVAGDTLYSWYEDVQHITPFPSFADVLYFIAYPLLATGLGLLIYHRGRSFDRAGLIDSAIVIVGLGLLSWVIVAGPILDSGDPLGDRLVAVAYPAGDILLLAMLVRLITAPGTRSAAFRLLSSAIVLLIVADTLFAAPAVLADNPAPLDLLWLSSYVLWGASALHPNMAKLTDATDHGVQTFTRRRLFSLTAAVMIAPLILAIQLAFGVALDAWAVVVASIMLFALVVARMACTIAEITSTARQRDKLQGDLSFQAVHDSLTGLANRAGVIQQIEAALHRGQRSGTSAGLLFIDLDHFKEVNDSLGHRAGDEVLAETAKRMRSCVRQGDTVGRLGGDEFVVLMESLVSEEEVVALSDRLLAAISAPLPVGGTTIRIGASIGIAISMDAGTDAAQLLHEADVAAYRAKTSGRGRSEVFGDNLRRELHQRAELETALAAGLLADEFALYYQPVIDISTGATRGYEALLRWRRPGHEVQQPDDFIPIAEKSDLVSDLDRWALREATRQLAEWTASDPGAFANLTVAVNISGRHLADACVVADVRRALEAAQLPPERLVLEITETVIVDVPTAVIHVRELRELGVSISLDDFGTGYTSIAQLQHLPVDTLKIDKSFVNFSQPGSRELVKLMINAAQFCGIGVIAEGVERQDQLEILRKLGCDSAQGFLFAHPVPAGLVADKSTVPTHKM
ncbi:MAG: hypothetical protein JWP10_1889 [Nocardioidaceae bacterium]|nr:hypothetical protein [Nocardioidaceae bacterium]